MAASATAVAVRQTVPISHTDEAEHRRLIATAVNRVIQSTINSSLTLSEIEAGILFIDSNYAPGYIRRYFAKVDAVNDDSFAWQQATDQCFHGGPWVVHDYGTSMAARISYRSGVTYLMGSNAMVKCLPNMANFNGRIFTAIGERIFDDDEDSLPVVWIGGIIDGNKANQGTYTDGSKEHNCGILLGAMGDQGGRLVAMIEGTRFQNMTGDGVQVHSNVDCDIANIKAFKCWRSGVAITGGFVKVRGTNWRLYGDSTDRSDLDIELDGDGEAFNGSGQMDIQLTNIDVANGDFEVSTSAAGLHDSRVVLNNINHRGRNSTWGTRGATTRVTNSHFRFGAMDGSVNRLIWPTDLQFTGCVFEFHESISATSTFGLDVWFNTGGTTDIDQIIDFVKCTWKANSTVESGDTTYGVHTRASPAADNNVVSIDGGVFHETLDEVFHMLGGGRVKIKGTPTFDAVLGLALLHSSTNFWHVSIYGSIDFGPNNTTYLSIDQGNASNILEHYGTEMDEANNVISLGGGSPLNNTFRGSRRVYFASAPGAASHGFRGDVGRIKAPAAATAVDYICVTSGAGSGAAWPVLATAA